MNKIQRQVMASVALIYAGRMATSTTAVKAYIVLVSIGVLARLVWVAKVVQNFSMVEKNGIMPTSHYMLYAVEHTQVAVQLTLLVAAVAFGMLVIDTVRSFSSRRTMLA